MIRSNYKDRSLRMHLLKCINIKFFFAAIVVFTMIISGYAQENSLSDAYNLLKAVKTKDYAKLQNYIKKGANVNTRDYVDGETPLYIASTLKDNVMVTLLLNDNAKTELAKKSTGETHLMAAVRLRAHKIAEILISQNANVNAADRNGETSLYKAVRENDRKSVSILLDANADWSLADNTGRTPLDLARENRRLRSMVKLLEQAGAEY